MTSGVALETERLILREPADDDAPALLAYHLRNDARFAPWEPKRGTDVAQHLQWIAWRRSEAAAGHAASFLAWDRAAQQTLVASVNLDAISREPLHSAMLSYTVDGAYEGKGYAREAVAALIDYAWGPLGLQSLSAHYDPANVRSGGLLRRLGFTVVASTPVIPGMERLMRAQVLATLDRS